MDITFERVFADPRGGADTMRRLARAGVVAIVFGSLAVWGVVGALHADDAPGFVHDAVRVTSSSGTMFSLPALAPGQTVTRYATVRSSGSAASLRMFATTSGTGLARFLTLTITLGTARYGTAGPEVVYSGPLSAFPASWNDGIDLGAAGSTRRLRFDIRLADEPAAQGRGAGADFRWEARQV
jgi:hypothetical protein